jgi:hypothetical protein
VVATVDGEFTLKHLARDESGFFLRPANPAYAPIRPKGEFQVFGVVVGLIRKYTPRASARGITDLGITPISVKVCLTLSNTCIYSFIKDNERACQG